MADLTVIGTATTGVWDTRNIVVVWAEVAAVTVASVGVLEDPVALVAPAVPAVGSMDLTAIIVWVAVVIATIVTMAGTKSSKFGVVALSRLFTLRCPRRRSSLGPTSIPLLKSMQAGGKREYCLISCEESERATENETYRERERTRETERSTTRGAPPHHHSEVFAE
jgi:hypothetical protein